MDFTPKDGQDKEDCGLNYARKLNFSDAQFMEAIKSLGPEYDENQLLQALIIASGRDQQTNQQDKLGHKAIGRSRSIETAPQMCNPRSQQQCYATPSGSIQDMSANDKSSNSTSSIVDSSTTSDSSSNLMSFEPVNLMEDSDPHTNIPKRQYSQQKVQLNKCRSIELRRIYIDGPNIARSHGKDIEFSWLGIRICVDWFRDRGHPVVKVFVPENLCRQASDIMMQEKQNNLGTLTILEYLTQINALVKTPAETNDDLFLIEAARLNSGVIVSNDRFRDEVKLNQEWYQYVWQNRLPYVFVDDLFIPANDPLGRTGPSLEQFLRVYDSDHRESLTCLHDKLKSERRSVVGPTRNQSSNSWAFQRRSLQHTSPSQNQMHSTTIKQEKSDDSLSESVKLINLYQLQRKNLKPEKTLAKPTCNSEGLIDASRGGSSIARRNALIRTKSHT